MKRIGFIMTIAMLLSCIWVKAQEIHYFIDGKMEEYPPNTDLADVLLEELSPYPPFLKPYLLPRKSYAFTDQNLCF